MSAKTIKPADPVVLRLREAARIAPDLSDAARLYEAILPVLRDADLGEAPLALAPGEVARLLAEGVPLLSGLSLDIDLQAAEELMLELLGRVVALAEIGRPPGRLRFWTHAPPKAAAAGNSAFAVLQGAARQIRDAFQSGRLDIAGVLSAAASGDLPGLRQTARGQQLDPELLWIMAQHCIKPALQSWRRQIAPAVDELSWHHGFCFLCGASATLGELQDNVQAKHLRCAQCGADWHFPVLQCLQCGNEEHSSRPHFYLDGQGDRRVEACDACHSYHKVITAFTPTEPELLVVEDLLSLQLDFVAQQRGYLKANSRYTAKPL